MRSLFSVLFPSSFPAVLIAFFSLVWRRQAALSELLPKPPSSFSSEPFYRTFLFFFLMTLTSLPDSTSSTARESIKSADEKSLSPRYPSFPKSAAV